MRVVVPFAPGGPTDIFARLIVQKLSDQLGKQFYIENVGGASGSIGTAQVAKAAPDGHTILLNVSSFAINPVFFAKVPYDPIREFEPITLAATNDVVIVAHPSVTARTMAELIAQMKGGAKFTFSSGGTGAVTHLLGEQLKQSLGVDSRARTLQRRRSGDRGGGRRPCAAVDQLLAARDAAHCGRAAACARRQRQEAFALAPRRADDGGGGLHRHER